MIQWPKKQFFIGKRTQKQDTTQQYRYGWNDAIDACKAADEQEPKLVPLDENKLRASLIPLFMRLGERASHPNDLNIAINIICAKFGTPKAGLELNRDKWYEIMMPYHGGNPQTWAKDLDRIYTDYFDPKTHKSTNAKGKI